MGADPVDQPSDWRFLRTPKWLVSHAAILLLVVGMVFAGLWQIDRHRERAERNDTIRERSALAPVDIAQIADPSSQARIGEREQFRRVNATGEYRPDDEVLVRNRTLDGSPGWWVLTPLITDEGWAVVVNRGWIPLTYDAEAERPGTEPPTGRVTVSGTVQPTRVAEGIQRADPAEGRLDSLARPDVARLAEQLEYPVAPLLLRLDEDPERRQSGELPVSLTLPALDGGPHASYAVQWFIFTAIALVGYPLILRRAARGSHRTPDDD